VKGAFVRLDDALDRIADIRRRMAGATLFRGYRSATALLTSAVAVVTAAGQALWLPRPDLHLIAYLDLWCAAAAVCAAVTAVGVWRCRSTSPVQRALAWSAAAQLLPSLVAGALLTYVLVTCAPATVWLLPGLWAVLFGLGVLASRPLLPRPVEWVGLFYLLAGLASVAWSARHAPFSPWVMALPFGVGQLAGAIVLYWTLERGSNGDET
jgi:hypothetical protein